MSAERRRLTLALLLSLLIHTLLLSLTFGGQGLGLPGFGLPWRERRIEAPDLRVMLAPVQVTAAEPAATPGRAPPPQASIEPAVASGPALTVSVTAASPRAGTAEAIVPEAKATAPAGPAPVVATAAPPARAPLRTEGPRDAPPPPTPWPEVIAVDRADQATWVVPPPSPVPAASSPATEMPVTPDAGEPAQPRAEAEVRERAVEVARPAPPPREAQRQADPVEAARVESERLAAAQLEAQRQEAARLEAARAEAARLEAQRREAARQAAAQLEAQRQEVARQEVARAEAARLEAQRQEAARQAAAQLEAQRQAAARQEAARAEVARLEALRQEAARLAAAQLETQRQAAARQEAAHAEAARLEAERQEAVRQAAVRQEAARAQAEQEEDARREARRRAMGRQLDEEAARRDAASTAARSASSLPYSLSTARRVRLWGRSDPNAELVQYAEAWARKIQLNTPVDTVREVAKRPHTNPLVTVAIRSDGSVESVTIVVSSGVAEVDETIRRIVQSHVPYQAFPPGLAREYDVVEIRRTWHFDMAIRLY